jgi:glycosyltransferase involved in cell wall biosynthesis
MVSSKTAENARLELSLPHDVTVVMTIAKLTPQKDLESFLYMACHVLGLRSSVMFLIAGTGPEEDALKKLSAKLNLQTAVRFLGFQSDVSSLLAASDIFVLTSQWEGLPRVVLEAMGAGKPVVAAAVSGVPELVVNDSTGFLVPRESPAKTAEAVVRLIDNPILRQQLGAAGQLRLSEHFSEDALAGKLLDTYGSFFAMKRR